MAELKAKGVDVFREDERDQGVFTGRSAYFHDPDNNALEVIHLTNNAKADMSRKLALTFACGDYEIMRALKEGIVEAEGIELTVLTDMAPSPRHWRFLRGREFDVAEVSGSGYVAARDQGLPFRAIPVFPHRRFRHGFIFVNTGKGIRKPTDLIGRKVGTKGYLFTAGLWMRGILEHDYGVPHKSIKWLSELDEDVEFTPPPGLDITQVSEDQSLEDMLVAGEIDALLSPDLIRPLTAGDARVGRLFPNYKEEEIAFYRKTGIFPIMHVVGIKQEIVERHPWVAINLYKAFDKAKALAMERMENPRIVPLAWYREGWEEQERILGKDPWEYGLNERNARNFERLVTYSARTGPDQAAAPLDELFLNVSEGRKRDEFRIYLVGSMKRLGLLVAASACLLAGSCGFGAVNGRRGRCASSTPSRPAAPPTSSRVSSPITSPARSSSSSSWRRAPAPAVSSGCRRSRTRILTATTSSSARCRSPSSPRSSIPRSAMTRSRT